MEPNEIPKFQKGGIVKGNPCFVRGINDTIIPKEEYERMKNIEFRIDDFEKLLEEISKRNERL